MQTYVHLGKLETIKIEKDYKIWIGNSFKSVEFWKGYIFLRTEIE
jgi:hypothetical protein